MPQNLFTQDTIAVIWDFDKTLSPDYMQRPLFEHYSVDEKEFWREVNGLEDFYRNNGIKRVSKDTLYLTHILSYVRAKKFAKLNNELLRALGSKIAFYEGIPEFFERSKEHVSNDATLAKHDIKVEHYIVSTGLCEMIVGSKVGKLVDDIWACEFVEEIAGPGYLGVEQASLFRQRERLIQDVGYVIDNTSKTRAIFEINKGTNKLSDIDVNATIAPEDRRIPFQNMIYVADVPSDIPAFSVVNQGGGATFAVYKARNENEFKQVAALQKQGRVQGIGEANYTEGSLTSMWLTYAIEEIANRIVKSRETLLSERVGRSPKHIVSDGRPKDAPANPGDKQVEQTSGAADAAISPAKTTEIQPRPPQPARPDRPDASQADPAA